MADVRRGLCVVFAGFYEEDRAIINGLRSGLFFFFQAEDGIRDDLVTGVQTCALPISLRRVYFSLSSWSRIRTARAPSTKNRRAEVRHETALGKRTVTRKWGMLSAKDRKSVV